MFSWKRTLICIGSYMYMYMYVGYRLLLAALARMDGCWNIQEMIDWLLSWKKVSISDIKQESIRVLECLRRNSIDPISIRSPFQTLQPTRFVNFWMQNLIIKIQVVIENLQTSKAPFESQAQGISLFASVFKATVFSTEVGATTCTICCTMHLVYLVLIIVYLLLWNW